MSFAARHGDSRSWHPDSSTFCSKSASSNAGTWQRTDEVDAVCAEGASLQYPEHTHGGPEPASARQHRTKVLTKQRHGRNNRHLLCRGAGAMTHEPVLAGAADQYRSGAVSVAMHSTLIAGRESALASVLLRKVIDERGGLPAVQCCSERTTFDQRKQ